MGCEQRTGHAQYPPPPPLCSTQVIADCELRFCQEHTAHFLMQKVIQPLHLRKCSTVDEAVRQLNYGLSGSNLGK